MSQALSRVTPNELHDLLFNAHPQPMWIWETDTLAIADVNEAALRQYGYGREEFLELKLPDLRPAEEVAQLLEYISRIQPNLVDSGVWRHLTKDGRIILADIRSYPIEFRSRPCRLVMAQDVTEARQTEHALDSVLRETTTILSSIADGVHVLDKEGKARSINPAAVAMLGWDESEFCGKQGHDLIHHHKPDGEVYPVEECPIRHTLRDGIPRRIAHEVFFRKDGSSIPVEYVCSGLRNGNGEISGAIVTFRDMTQRRHADEFHAVESKILKSISSGVPQGQLLETIACLTERLLPSMQTAITLLDPKSQRLKCGAGPSLPQMFLDGIAGSVNGQETIPSVAAISRRKTIIVGDFATDPLWNVFGALALNHGLRSCLSVPLIGASGEALGSFNVYGAASGRPCSRRLRLVHRLARLTAVGIEQNRILESLRASEDRFREIAENVQDVFWIRDAASRKLFYVSPAYERIWARSCASLYQNPASWLESIHSADRPVVIEALQDPRNDQYIAEYRIVRPDGQERWILDRGYPIYGADGVVSKVVGTARDITARKKAEIALRKSEERFEAVASAVADVLWDWNLVDDTIWWSDDAETLFGYPKGSLGCGSAWLGRIHRDDRVRVARSIESALRGRDDFWSCEYRLHHANGEISTVNDHGRLIFDEAGRPVRFVGGITDITERKRSQEALRERIKELRCLYAVLDLTSDTRRPVHAVCADIVQLLPGSFLHDDIAVARVELDGKSYPCKKWRAPVTSLKAVIPTSDGHCGVVEVGYLEERAALEEGDGPFLAEEKAMIEAVAAHIGRMIDSRQMASRITQSERLSAVGELTGGIAHDFNNLLTVMIGNSEILATRLREDRSLGRLAEMTRDAAERGAELTSRLLAFARKQALTPEITRVDDLIANMTDLLRHTLGGHIEFDTISPDDLWPVEIDTVQLENAILNLCINARDAMQSAGRLVIEASNVELSENDRAWEEEVAPGQYVMIAVSDTGEGMPSEVAERAFEPFFTTKTTGEGTGLGLSMVYGFARQSRGYAKIDSRPGHGTTVKLYIPKTDGDEGSIVVRPLRVGHEERPPTGGSEMILLVEDDDLVREHVEAQIRSLGYRVTAVGSGTAAVEILKRNQPVDLLFTDVVMPGGMNGRELVEIAGSIRPHLPVVFTTGYTDDAALMDGCLEAEIELLSKPYRLRDLAESLQRGLSRRLPIPGKALGVDVG